MVTNMDTGDKWMWQRAMGPLGHAAQPHKGAARGAKWPCHVIDPWELLQKQCKASTQCSLIDGQEWMALIHGPIVIHLGGSNRLTNRRPTRILTCDGFTTAIGSQPAL